MVVRFSVRATIGATVTNVSAASFGSVHALPVAFGYLKIIEKQQPKYVDKLTPHITKLLQKLIKDHTSAGVDYNPGKLPSGKNRDPSPLSLLLSFASIHGVHRRMSHAAQIPHRSTHE